MFKTVLAGIDHGETCDVVFGKALALAQSVDAELILLGVLVPPDRASLTIPATASGTYSPSEIDESVWSVYQDSYKEYEVRELDRLKDYVQKATAVGVQARCYQLTGHAGRAICEQAKAQDAELIVVGSHQRMGISEMLLGSVSNYVMHHAACSVLVLHDVL